MPSPITNRVEHHIDIIQTDHEGGLLDGQQAGAVGAPAEEVAARQVPVGAVGGRQSPQQLLALVRRGLVVVQDPLELPVPGRGGGGDVGTGSNQRCV